MAKANAKKTKQSTKAVKDPKPLISVAQLLWLILLLVLAVALSFGGQKIYQTIKNQPIDKVGFKGELQYISQQKLVKQVQAFLDDGFALLKLDAIRKDLVRNAWVKEARVERSAPGEIMISIDEHNPIARWGSDRLMSDTGELFKPDTVLGFAHLPHFFGKVEETKKIAKQYRDLLDFFKQFDMTTVSLEKNQNDYWKILLEGNVEVFFMEPIEENSKKRFSKIYHQELKSVMQKVKRIDLRYSNGVAVAWRG